jgi:Flp pilus assembly protein TadG
MRITRRSGCHARRLRDEAGQALVEFAFVMMMMLVLILGLIDFARVFLQFQVVTDAAREGARNAVIARVPPMTEAEISAIIENALRVGGIDVTGAETIEDCARPSGSVDHVTIYSCDWESTDNGAVIRVGIAVPYEFAIVGPFIGMATGSRYITLRSSIAMRSER